MKNGIFWDVTPCDSCRNRVSEEHIASVFKVKICVPPKRWFLEMSHDVTAQKTALLTYRRVVVAFEDIIHWLK
jgi:hypothetical protein